LSYPEGFEDALTLCLSAVKEAETKEKAEKTLNNFVEQMLKKKVERLKYAVIFS
jgi:hypothetical protein